MEVRSGGRHTSAQSTSLVILRSIRKRRPFTTTSKWNLLVLRTTSHRPVGLEWCTRTAVRYLVFGVWEHPTTEICPGSDIHTAAMGCIQGMYISVDQRELEGWETSVAQDNPRGTRSATDCRGQISAAKWLILKVGVRFQPTHLISPGKTRWFC